MPRYFIFQKSPFCTERPIFTLAEPDDLVVVCGEFNSGIEIIELSREPEQVFTIKKIVNHPHYQPNRVITKKLQCLEISIISFYILMPIQ